jgi:hypothetical protein
MLAKFGIRKPWNIPNDSQETRTFHCYIPVFVIHSLVYSLIFPIGCDWLSWCTYKYNKNLTIKTANDSNINGIFWLRRNNNRVLTLLVRWMSSRRELFTPTDTTAAKRLDFTAQVRRLNECVHVLYMYMRQREREREREKHAQYPRQTIASFWRWTP